MTIDTPRGAALSSTLIVASGVEKSIITSAFLMALSGLSVILTPILPVAATSPASLPRKGEPSLSRAPESFMPPVAAIALIIATPILPPAPVTTAFIISNSVYPGAGRKKRNPLPRYLLLHGTYVDAPQ